MSRALLLLAAGVLALSSQAAKPWVENRLVYNGNLPQSRDGLSDDRDYFPDEYLDAVADCGMSGIWMWVKWRDVVETSFAPRPPEGARRLAKLRSIARKCRRHCLSLWAFGIEPAHFTDGDPLLAAHPELAGAHFPSVGWRMWCPSSPAALRYAEEAARDLFTQVPELGGLLNIAYGEGTTTCMDGLYDSSCFSENLWQEGITCERCRGRAVWELYADMSAAIVRGIRAAGGSQPYLSWFYQPTTFPERRTWNFDCAAHAPDGATFVYNFESGLLTRDRGKFRCGGDYWLSQAGPSGPFRLTASAALAAGRRIGAKIQTCNSHELATLPYVPAPGLLYRKYREMRKCGVGDVVQSWFFGSEPSPMLKAAGMLSREDFSDGEAAFLLHLAAAVWGEALAPHAVKAWSAFSDAFAKYPVDNKMGYYGPFHSGIAWPYHPEVSCTGLPRSWWPDEPPAGDRIGECLGTYTLDEVEASAEEMAGLVRDMPSLSALAASAPAERRGDVAVMKAFRLQLLAARDVFRFYRLRRDAIAASRREPGRAKALLAQMEATVDDARRLAEEMLPVAEADSRIGFHAEAAKRTYDPTSVRRQIADLRVVAVRIREIADLVEAGRPWPESARECASPGTDIKGDGVVWRHEADADGNLVVEGRSEGEAGRLDVVLSDLAGALPPIVVKVDDARSFRVVVDAAQWGHDETRRPSWILLARPVRGNPSCRTMAWPVCREPVRCRLFQPSVVPERFGRLGERR